MQTAPVFVKIDDYQDVLDVVQLLKEKVAHAKKTLSSIQELREKEAHELDAWSGSLRLIEEKVEHIDGSLLDPQV